MLATGTVFNGRELTAFQKRAERHVSFSVTTACPLRCRHCLVATVSARDHESVALPAQRAEAFAREMPALAAEGVERISFTGGEPLLAESVLDVLSAAAAAHGIGCTVVTACHWARTPEQAREVVARLPHIDRWHLSMDRYHAEFLPLQPVIHAAKAAVALGRDVLIRAAVPDPPADEDRQLLADLMATLPPQVELAVQPISRVGRAVTLPLPRRDRVETPPAPPPRRPWIPCMSTGPLVLASGSLRPCCSSLADASTDHPFRTPSADAVGLVGVYRAWRNDPLLKLVRSVGFAPVLEWAQGTDGLRGTQPLPSHPCDQCTALWRIPGAVERVRERLEDTAVHQQIDALYDTVFADTATA